MTIPITMPRLIAEPRFPIKQPHNDTRQQADDDAPTDV